MTLQILVEWDPGGRFQHGYLGNCRLWPCAPRRLLFQHTDSVSGRNSYYASNGRNYEVSGTICKEGKIGLGNRTLRRKQNPPRFQLQKYVWNTILMKPQTGITYRPVWSFRLVERFPDEQEPGNCEMGH